MTQTQSGSAGARCDEFAHRPTQHCRTTLSSLAATTLTGPLGKGLGAWSEKIVWIMLAPPLPAAGDLRVTVLLSLLVPAAVSVTCKEEHSQHRLRRAGHTQVTH